MNCKPGDLAIVTYTPTGENVGSVVKILRHWGIWADLGDLWTVEFARPIQAYSAAWSWSRDGRGVPSGIKTVMQQPDKWLRPVSGLPLDEELPAAVNMPEAFRLALGIEMRTWA